MPSSAQTRPSIAVRDPERMPSVRSVGSRSSLVATGDPAPMSRRPANSPARSASGPGELDRVRGVPGTRPSARSASAPLHAECRPARPRVRSRRRAIGIAASPPPGSRSRSRRQSRASRTAARRRTGRRAVERRWRAPIAQPLPHRAELDERAVLVEDDEVDAVEADRSHRPRRPPPPPACAIARGPRTKRASGGNDSVTAAPRHRGP